MHYAVIQVNANGTYNAWEAYEAEDASGAAEQYAADWLTTSTSPVAVIVMKAVDQERGASRTAREYGAVRAYSARLFKVERNPNPTPFFVKSLEV